MERTPSGYPYPSLHREYRVLPKSTTKRSTNIFFLMACGIRFWIVLFDTFIDFWPHLGTLGSICVALWGLQPTQNLMGVHQNRVRMSNSLSQTDISDVFTQKERTTRKCRFGRDRLGFDEHTFRASTLLNEHLALARCRFPKKHNFQVLRFSKRKLLK